MVTTYNVSSLEYEWSVHVRLEASRHLDDLAVLGPQRLPHGGQEVDVSGVAAAPEGVDEGVAARARGPEAADVGVGARLAVLAAGEHHHVTLTGPGRSENVVIQNDA